ncbi:hypothetical protein BAUCODRAFT_79681, partial [Baudoinia panamericana UAMH 10762]
QRCSHDMVICGPCWQSWLEVQVATQHVGNIYCAQCDSRLGRDEIQDLAADVVYGQYVDAEVRAMLTSNPDFVWCQSGNCTHGQLHTGDDIFRCGSCGYKHCMLCDVVWHAGETCGDHHAKIVHQKQHRQRAEISSESWIKTYAKQCPWCRRKIQKDGGCDHMTCRVCRHQFCWVCLASYNNVLRLGNQKHKKSCIYYRPWLKRRRGL